MTSSFLPKQLSQRSFLILHNQKELLKKQLSFSFVNGCPLYIRTIFFGTLDDFSFVESSFVKAQDVVSCNLDS
jgi:hypothetical protein